jgi:hypothetical protein
MHYLDSNTNFSADITLNINTRVNSSTLVDLELYSENENKLVYSSTSNSLIEQAYYQTITDSFQDSLEDKKTYTILLLSGGIVVYQDKIYVDRNKDFTSETTRMTDGQYTSNTTNNDYIII